MMLRQSIWLGLLMLLIASPEPKKKDMKEEMERRYMAMNNYCSMDEFEELNYYLFCDTQLHEGAGGFTLKPSIISSETKTIEEAKQLYQEFVEKLTLEPKQKDERDGTTHVSDISPDCKWIKIVKWNKQLSIMTQTLFFEKEKVREKVNEVLVENHPILIVKNGDGYREMDEEHYEILDELEREGYFNEGYSPVWEINAEGNLLAGVWDNDSLFTIRKIEDGTEQWSFSLQEIREEVAWIRDDIQEEDTVRVYMAI